MFLNVFHYLIRRSSLTKAHILIPGIPTTVFYFVMARVIYSSFLWYSATLLKSAPSIVLWTFETRHKVARRSPSPHIVPVPILSDGGRETLRSVFSAEHRTNNCPARFIWPTHAVSYETNDRAPLCSLDSVFQLPERMLRRNGDEVLCVLSLWRIHSVLRQVLLRK